MSVVEELETKRLFLRVPEMSDAPSVAELANNINVAQNLGMMPYPYSLEDAKQWLERKRIDHGAHGIVFALHQKAEPGFIGTISVFNLSIGKPEFGFWLGEPHWGKGYMSEAGCCLRDYLFDQLDAPFLLSKHILENPGSGRVAEKCGLKEDGFEPLWSRQRAKFMPGRRLRLARKVWQKSYNGMAA